MNVLITAGPTREPIDPIRFLSNRSTGKMGFALAEEGMHRGNDVTLIAGPVHLSTPDGVRRLDVMTADEMCEAVIANVSACDVLIMAAAVADWRPAQVQTQKMKKHDGTQSLELSRTRDILMTVKPLKGQRLYVGFAAETENVCEEALRKCNAKGLDLIVANDASQPDAAFEADTNRVWLVDASGQVHAVDLMSKRAVASRIFDRIDTLFASR